MEKLSEEDLNYTIEFYEEIVHEDDNETILTCLLELKQLRAEKKANAMQSKTL